GRLVRDARRRLAGRRGLPVPRGPHRRRDRARRRESLARRDRGGAARARVGRRLRRGRRAGRAMGRSGGGRGGAARRRSSNAAGAARLGARATALRAHARAHRVSHRAALQRDRQAGPPPDPRRAGRRCMSGVLSLLEAVERLRSPEVFESCSPVSGEPALVVDLGSAPAPTAGARAARAALAALPCPSIALVAERALAPAAARWLARFDVVVRAQSELASVLAAVRRAPLAAQVLVQLLRGGERRDVEAGLVAESLAYSTLQG